MWAKLTCQIWEQKFEVVNDGEWILELINEHRQKLNKALEIIEIWWCLRNFNVYITVYIYLPLKILIQIYCNVLLINTIKTQPIIVNFKSFTKHRHCFPPRTIVKEDDLLSPLFSINFENQGVSGFIFDLSLVL